MRAAPFASRFLSGFAVALLLGGCANTKMMAPAIDEPKPAASGTASLLAKNPNGQIIWIGQGIPEDTAAPSTATSTSDFDNLEVLNESLKDKLSVLRVGSGRSDSNLLSVFAGVKNNTGHRLDLEMQTLYRDKDGHPLSDGRGSWIPISLKPHEEVQYRSVAISEDATDFLVRIRHASAAGTAQASQ
jgi:hypothetical protein